VDLPAVGDAAAAAAAAAACCCFDVKRHNFGLIVVVSHTPSDCCCTAGSRRPPPRRSMGLCVVCVGCVVVEALLTDGSSSSSAVGLFFLFFLFFRHVAVEFWALAAKTFVILVVVVVVLPRNGIVKQGQGLPSSRWSVCWGGALRVYVWSLVSAVSKCPLARRQASRQVTHFFRSIDRSIKTSPARLSSIIVNSCQKPTRTVSIQSDGGLCPLLLAFFLDFTVCWRPLARLTHHMHVHVHAWIEEGLFFFFFSISIHSPSLH
jgi:hypothetical protein